MLPAQFIHNTGMLFMVRSQSKIEYALSVERMAVSFPLSIKVILSNHGHPYQGNGKAYQGNFECKAGSARTGRTQSKAKQATGEYAQHLVTVTWPQA